MNQVIQAALLLTVIATGGIFSAHRKSVNPEPLAAISVSSATPAATFFAKGRAVFYGEDHTPEDWLEYYYTHKAAGREYIHATGPSPGGYHCVNVDTDLVGVKFLIVTADGYTATCTTADIVQVQHKKFNHDDNRVIEVPQWVFFNVLHLTGDTSDTVTIYRVN